MHNCSTVRYMYYYVLAIHRSSEYRMVRREGYSPVQVLVHCVYEIMAVYTYNECCQKQNIRYSYTRSDAAERACRNGKRTCWLHTYVILPFPNSVSKSRFVSFKRRPVLTVYLFWGCLRLIFLDETDSPSDQKEKFIKSAPGNFGRLRFRVTSSCDRVTIAQVNIHSERERSSRVREYACGDNR